MRAAGLRPSSAIARALLALVCGLGLLVQALILSDGLTNDPLARIPVNDAAVYWQWAGDIARGELIGRTPFLSAPLYPYAVGLLRALGGELFALYVVQAILHAATALLLYRIACLRFPADPGSGWHAGRIVGIAAAALYLFLLDAAYYPGRVLGSTLQAFLAAWLWERMLAPSAFRARGAALVGLVLGLNVLATPAMLAAVPLVAIWTYLGAGRGAAGARRALAGAALALVVVLPATVHNFLACGEVIGVSAQAGVTFYHGNAPGADGTYHPIEGISTDRMKQNADARALLVRETGGSWRRTSSAFFAKGLAWMRSDPGGALRLVARKLHWFLSGRNYGDIYVPALEIDVGGSRWLRFAPLHAAWLVIPALAALAVLARERLRAFPEALLLLAPLATVLVFWYSPRYRLPALPVVAVLGAWALVRIVRGGALRTRVFLAASFAVALALGPVDRALGFDALDPLRARFHLQLGQALLEENRLEEALWAFERADALGSAEAGVARADVLRRLRRTDEALAALRRAVELRPRDVYARRSLAIALAERPRRFDEAEAEFVAALALDPGDWQSLVGLGNVQLQTGRAEEAAARFREAIDLWPSYANAWYGLGLAQADLGQSDAAERSFRRAIEIDLDHHAARLQLVRSLVARGARRDVVALLDAEHRRRPEDIGMASNLAWQLATAPEDELRDGPRALELAQRVVAGTRGGDPYALDTLAAALAECGRFGEALESAERALAILRARGAPETAEVAERAELYRSGRAFRQVGP